MILLLSLWAIVLASASSSSQHHTRRPELPSGGDPITSFQVMYPVAGAIETLPLEFRVEIGINAIAAYKSYSVDKFLCVELNGSRKKCSPMTNPSIIFRELPNGQYSAQAFITDTNGNVRSHQTSDTRFSIVRKEVFAAYTAERSREAKELSLLEWAMQRQSESEKIEETPVEINQEDVAPIMNASDVFLVIGVKTAVVKNFDLRQAIRETWASANTLPSTAADSVRYNLEKQTYGDLLTDELRCEDTYADLPNKVKEFLRFATPQFARTPFFMIADDDIYLRAGELVDELRDLQNEIWRNPSLCRAERNVAKCGSIAKSSIGFDGLPAGRYSARAFITDERGIIRYRETPPVSITIVTKEEFAVYSAAMMELSGDSSRNGSSLLKWATHQQVLESLSIPTIGGTKTDATSNGTLLVIGVKTAVVKNFEFRQTIRETWASPDALPHNVKVFFVGCGPNLSAIKSIAERERTRVAIAWRSKNKLISLADLTPFGIQSAHANRVEKRDLCDGFDEVTWKKNRTSLNVDSPPQSSLASLFEIQTYVHDLEDTEYLFVTAASMFRGAYTSPHYQFEIVDVSWHNFEATSSDPAAFHRVEATGSIGPAFLELWRYNLFVADEDASPLIVAYTTESSYASVVFECIFRTIFESHNRPILVVPEKALRMRYGNFPDVFIFSIFDADCEPITNSGCTEMIAYYMQEYLYPVDKDRAGRL
ncbi:Glycosyl transferase, family 31 [Phytophthora cactorum]|nr:Glycosyl transferase, family 31 [Phytophthora cactorum]